MKRHYLFTALLACSLLLLACKKDLNPQNAMAVSTTNATNLPPWLEKARVQAHFRLSLNHFKNKKDLFIDASSILKEMGVRAYTRHFKTGGEQNWWESANPKIASLPTEILKDVHGKGMNVIAYYRHMENNEAARSHPNWMCRDNKGQIYERRGAMMCLNSPYRDQLIADVIHLASLGVDGIYFDEVHMPPEACWCDFCKEGFAKESPEGHPKGARGPNLPLFMKLKDFNNRTIVSFFKDLKKGLIEAGYQTPIIVSSNTWPNMADNTMISELFQHVDLHKTEMKIGWNMGNPKMLYSTQKVSDNWPLERSLKLSLGFVLARDATNGNPAHIWTHGLLNDESATAAVAGMVGHGNIANIDIEEERLRDQPYKPAIALGNQLSDVLAGSRPSRWFGIYFSEKARDTYFQTPKTAWEKHIMPIYGAYATACKLGAPVGMLTDAHMRLKMTGGYKVIFVPNQTNLPEVGKAALASFEAKGGKVIYANDADVWHLEKGQKEAMKNLREQLLAANPPTQVRQASKGMETDVFQKGNDEWLFTAINDYGWVYTGNWEKMKERNMEQFQKQSKQSLPPPCDAFKLVLRRADKPASVTNALTGEALPFNWLEGQKAYVVDVPRFQHITVVAVKY